MDANGVTLDTFKVIVALNYFGKDHQDIQFAIQDCLKLATALNPFKPKDLREFIEDKQCLINANNCTDVPLSSTALATQTSKPSKDKGTCGNCNGPFHIAKYCIKPGGGMEGKAIEESKTKRQADREAEGKGGAKTQHVATQQKIKVPYTDSSGRAFMLEVDASLLTPSTTNTPTATTVQPFVGIAAIDPNTLVSSTEYFEHSGFATTFKFDLAYIMELPTIATQNLTYHVSLTTVAKSTESDPFYIDSGASGHLTPNSEDFFELRSIPPHPINGIGGSIMALGIGNIRVKVPNRKPIILYNALYVPKSGVRLISVSSLWRFSQFHVPLLGEIAHITDSRDASILAYASLIPQKELYALNVMTPIALVARHALATTSTPTFETWHKQMGHANYQCLEHMARKGMVKGMPTSFPSAPPKCESCLLGKQTKSPVPKKRMEGPGHRATRRLEKVWVDLTGPQATASCTGHLYIMDIVDDYTNCPCR
jgi:hypothetical protein